MHSDELDLMEFIDGTADAAVASHVEACPGCQRAVRQFVDLGGSPAAWSDPRPVEVEVSPGVVQALERDLPEQVRAGQLWRARWDIETLLVYVVRFDSSGCQLAPASLDVQLAEPRTRVVDEDESPLGVPVGVWAGRSLQAPFSLLERYLGTIDGNAVAADGLTPAADDLTPLDDRTVYAERLRDALRDLITAAAWEPAGPPEPLSLATVLGRAGLTMADLPDLLGIDVPTALDLWRGDVAPSGEQLAALDTAAEARGSGVVPSQATGPALPPELLLELARPRWKARVLAAASMRDLSEEAARRAAAAEALGLTLAARRRRTAESDWGEMLDRVLP